MRFAKHQAHCTVCKHPDRAEIDRSFVNWESRPSLEEKYALPRDSLYRHAKACGLYDRRQHNLVGSLEKIIRRGLSSKVGVTMTNVIEAIKVHGKLTGQWVDWTGEVDKMFPGKSLEDIKIFGRTGKWPSKEPEQEQ